MAGAVTDLGVDAVGVADMADNFAGVRLLGPPETDGEYIVLSEHETVHLHEYTRIYAVPGLYEHVVQERLQCTSPQVAAAGLLREATRVVGQGRGGRLAGD